jgi:hypothetical protein
MTEELVDPNQYQMDGVNVVETELSDSDSDSTNSSAIEGEVNKQFDVEIALYDQRFARGLLAHRRLEALEASDPLLMDGVQTNTIDSDSGNDSEPSTVSENRFAGLDKD